MTRYAIGDVHGCYDELRELVSRLRFSADRDVLWLVGDLVNRGPRSLDVLRYVRSLGDNAIVVLGNHDLHLLALACGGARHKSGDTLQEVLEAPDRDALIEWLIERPLAHHDTARADLLVHAGLVPQWTAQQAVELAGEVQAALRRDPRSLFDGMYGDRPDRWSESLEGIDRLRFVINVLTRLRVCAPDGRVDLKIKGKPDKAPAPLRPWFEHESRLSRDVRVIFGHWSALGFVEAHGVVGLDTGCVWGGLLSAFDLDEGRLAAQVPCAGHQTPGSD